MDTIMNETLKFKDFLESQAVDNASSDINSKVWPFLRVLLCFLF